MPTTYLATLNFGDSVALNFPFGAATSIQKEFIRNEDGTVLTEKHTINIKGTLVSEDGSDTLSRYRLLLQQATDFVSQNASSAGAGSGRKNSLQGGKLQLMIGGGDAFDNKYTFAKLTGASSTEPPEDTAGIQYIEVNMTFECDNIAGSVGTYKLRSASETFEFKREEDLIAYGNEAGLFTGAEDSSYFGWTFTHTLSAQGIVKSNGVSSEAFNEAYRYVQSRAKDSLKGVTISTDANGNSLFNNFSLTNWDVSASAGTVEALEYRNPATAGQLSNIRNFNEYNRISTETMDTVGGGYNLSRTYFFSNAPYTMEITGTYEKSEDGIDSVKVDGKVDGLNINAYNAKTHDKYANAVAGINQIIGTGTPFGSGTPIYKFAEKVFGDRKYTPFYNSNMVLDVRPISSSIGENKVTGSITFSASYKPIPAAVLGLKNAIPNCISVTVNINDNNRYFDYVKNEQMKKIAIIPIIGRKRGPVIQDMSTTKECERSATLEATVDVIERYPESHVVGSGVKLVLDRYSPQVSRKWLVDIDDVWDWSIGKLTITAKWVYEKD